MTTLKDQNYECLFKCLFFRETILVVGLSLYNYQNEKRRNYFAISKTNQIHLSMYESKNLTEIVIAVAMMH